MAALANINRDAKRKPEAFKPTDFIPWHEVHFEPPKPIDPKVQTAQLKALFRSVAAAAAAADQKKQG